MFNQFSILVLGLTKIRQILTDDNSCKFLVICPHQKYYIFHFLIWDNNYYQQTLASILANFSFIIKF